MIPNIWKFTGGIASTSESDVKKEHCTRPSDDAKLNDSVWLLRKPREGRHSLDVIFVHGLQSSYDGEAFWKTWLSRDKTVIWPKEWLGECIPDARILAISYDSDIKWHDGQMHPYLTLENLVQDIILSRTCNAGQTSSVIFVGHCIGGIIIEKFLLACHSEVHQSGNREDVDRLKRFLKNCKGIFYYGTPHWGSGLPSSLRKAEGIPPLVEYLKILSPDMARITNEFSRLQANSHWMPRLATKAIGESLETKFQGFKGELVTEASARAPFIQGYYWIKADHFDVSRANNKTNCSIFTILHDFIHVLERGDGAEGSTTRSTDVLKIEREIEREIEQHVKTLTEDGSRRSHDAQGIAKSAKALTNLAAGDLEVCKKIGNCDGALVGLVGGLRKDRPGAPHTQRYCAKALANLAAKEDHDHDLRKKIINTPRAVEELLDGLDGDDQDLQEKCAEALANLAKGDLEVCWKIGNCHGASHGALVGLVGGLRKDRPGSSYTQMYCAKALAHFAAKEPRDHDHDLRKKIINTPEAVEELVNGLCSDDIPKLQAQCAQALANLAVGDLEVCRKIANCHGASHGALEGLVGGLRKDPLGAGAPHTRRYCAKALACLAGRADHYRDHDLKLEIVRDPRALEELANGLKSDDQVLRVHCARAFADLARHDRQICRKIWDVPGAVDGLDRLANMSSDSDAKTLSREALRNLQREGSFGWNVAEALRRAIL